MEWVRGETIGHGSFAYVSLAKPTLMSGDSSNVFAVKSCNASCSASLVSEKSVLQKLMGCPHIIGFFGNDISYENGGKLYNLLMEYASGGDLGWKIKNSDQGRLPEKEVRRHARSVVQGLKFIHGNGFVHCDIKPENILLCSAVQGGREIAKIGDFGLAKVAGERVGVNLRGTPLYMSPEMVRFGEQESPADIWALGCLVTEMITGRPIWQFTAGENRFNLFLRIGDSDQFPMITDEISDEGKDFLEKCFVRDPKQRWSAEKLLNHPFLASNGEDEEVHVILTSPRCPFDFHSQNTLVLSDSITNIPSPVVRIRHQSTTEMPDWSCSGNWVAVR